MATTEAPTAVEPEETPYPTPDPTPVLAAATCPDGRDEAGRVFYFDPAKVSESEAAVVECGTLAPVGGICPEERQGRGLSFEFDPDEMTEDQAVEQNCGMTKEQILDVCETLDETSRKRILKGPPSIVGNCYKLFVLIRQFDAATGPCSFFGPFWESRPWLSREMEAQMLGHFGLHLDPELAHTVKDCPFFDDVFEGHVILVYGTYTGTLTYETTDGGYNTVPAFAMEASRTSGVLQLDGTYS